MINLICIVMVHIGPKFDNVFMEGKLVQQLSNGYVVDFSKEASKKGYEGDYSQIYADKANCGPARKEYIV